MADWNTTKLWNILEKKKTTESEAICTVLKNPSFLPKIQIILSKAETANSDFTLHDQDHSFRVAEMMVKVISPEMIDKLSEYEIMLLLLSAYLHDIGMTPELKKVNGIKEALIDGKLTVITESERKSLQHWLDEQDADFEVGKDKYDTQDFEGHKNLFQTIKYYCRERHNDWSGEWIDENLKEIQIEKYPNWQNDLKNICKSHHYGLNELLDTKFDALQINSKIVNLRYLAMCLRISDVLENDPERTPDVIFQHRNISKDSTIYWYKDHSFQIDIRHDAPIEIYARPNSAFIHKAVMDTAKLIENELRLCQDIVSRDSLNNNVTKRHGIEYKWALQSHISTIPVTPLNNQYEYIDGYFRPKIAKVLELLGGEQLYGNTNAAVRELIQNAFDATRIQIAYDIIKNDLPYDDWALKLGDKYPVNIKLEKDNDDNYWLICEDRGIGMSKRIITDYLLVTGASKSTEISELERECRKKGFELERTGQFGIGILSYFMIADQIIITTKRSEFSTEKDHEAWQFTVHGIADFGELKKVSKPIHGTEIKLKLKKTTFGEDGYKDWEMKIKNYIEGILIRIPCTFTLSPIHSETKTVKTGWTIDVENIVKNGRERVRNRFHLWNSDEGDEALEIERLSFYNEIQVDYDSKVRYLKQEGCLPNNLGKFLIYFQYFELEKGNSFNYIFENSEVIGYHRNEGLYENVIYPPINNSNVTSWKGIYIDSPWYAQYELPEPIISSQYPYNIVLDISNLNSKRISVSRDFLNIDDSTSWKIIEHCDSIYQSIISNNKELFIGEYSFFNFLMCKNKSLISQDLKTHFVQNREFYFDYIKDFIFCGNAVNRNKFMYKERDNYINEPKSILIDGSEKKYLPDNIFKYVDTNFIFEILFSNSDKLDWKLYCSDLFDALEKSIVRSSAKEHNPYNNFNEYHPIFQLAVFPSNLKNAIILYKDDYQSKYFISNSVYCKHDVNQKKDIYEHVLNAIYQKSVEKIEEIMKDEIAVSFLVIEYFLADKKVIFLQKK